MTEPIVTAGPWTVNQIDYKEFGLDRSFEITSPTRAPVVQTIMREIKRDHAALLEDEANMRFIAACHAACSSVNPSHPEKVAPETAEAFRLLAALRTWGEKTDTCENYLNGDSGKFPGENGWETIQNLSDEAARLLSRAGVMEGK